ncbi:spinocerebellar ataxia type 10 protein domain-containing protein [Fimicolochytrium jonesii]|uniref:spinocerebellar ataxia type 10 protein domain-containing protein n=1 Tax=Fimicolochytrium jonesii TaxID=1396493 RepID=UPI0022FE965B|nr:spinocerebellar ataxia type 10 protein domain-containing protein [Fimicolochytrium jonesii]KAI8825777.1 spinocerebellar ataxia type 10 protein domain-containing protein [Fimicolochytrium jonesii]
MAAEEVCMAPSLSGVEGTDTIHLEQRSNDSSAATENQQQCTPVPAPIKATACTYTPEDLEGLPELAVRLLTAWRPLLERINAGCSAPPAYEHLAEATAVVDSVAKELAKDVELRQQIAQTPYMWESLRTALIFTRNHLFCVFGVGKTGVACPKRAERAVDLATAHFQLVRNLCAQVRSNQQDAWEQGFYEPMEEIISYLCSWLMCMKKGCCINMRERVAKCVSMGTQMLANMMTGNPDVQDKLWPRYFTESDLLLQLINTADVHQLTYVLICILNCTMMCRDRCMYVIGTAIGRDLLKVLLDKAEQLATVNCNAFDYVYAIFRNMIELDMTPNIMHALCHGRDPNRKHVLFQQHITYLRLLDGLIDAQPHCDSHDHSPPSVMPIDLGIDTLVLLVVVLRKTVDAVRRNLEEVKDLTVINEAPRSVFGLDLEGIALLLHCIGRVASELGPDAKIKLMNAHLGKSLIDLMHFLNSVQPRSTIKTLPPTRQNVSSQSSSHASTPTASSPTPPSTPPMVAQQEPTQSPFFMLKCDVIKIISNLSYEAKEVQDAFRLFGGVEAVLSQCAIDDDNPFIKEQSILALRNLLDGNPANQALVASLRPQGIEPSSQRILAEANLSARVDDATGKVRVGPAASDTRSLPPVNFSQHRATSRIESQDTRPASRVESLDTDESVDGDDYVAEMTRQGARVVEIEL